MTQVNIYDTAIELFTEAKEESKRAATTVELMRLNNVKLTQEHDELLKDYDQLYLDCEQAEAAITDTGNLTTRLMAVSSAVESLTDDNVELQAKLKQALNEALNVSGLNKKIAEQAVEIKSLAAYKRKTEVLARDLKLAEAKLQTAKTKPVKQAKVTKSHKKLQEENLRLNKYIKELVEYGQSAPQFLGGLKHSKQGVMDFVDCKPELMSVKEGPDSPEVEKLVQRVIVINKHNSNKTMTRIIGEPGLHTCKISKGCTVQIDDEVREHVEEYFKTLDVMNAKLKKQKAA